jgi:triosephosphate isomerase
MQKDRNLTIAGNWKMNNTVAAALALVNDLTVALAHVTAVDIVVCPPFTALSDVAQALRGSNIHLGAQDMSAHNAGAYTGDIAAEMLQELAVRYVILGHSERRQYHQELDACVARKAQAAHAASLQPIICVGETLSQREAGHMEQVLATQVRESLTGLTTNQMVETMIAYEPVWAIGTGKTASPEQAQEAHAFIRGVLVTLFDEATARRVRIQYGGSVRPSNARELMSQPDVDGALVGGASLDAQSFTEIVNNAIETNT